MQIICVSRGSFAAGKALSEMLAKKLGYACVGREQLIEEAMRAGIQVGKLETAMIKPHLFTERLAREKDHFRAHITLSLCERALKGNLVYHGRTGHMLLPGVDPVFRIRVIADMEFRIRSVMYRLTLDRDKSREYIGHVEEDRAHWVREFYGVQWDEAAHYDVIVNTGHVSVDNASVAMCAMAQLPEFQMTPASRQSLEDLLLAARVRVAVAQHPQTHEISVKVRANQGNVIITYLPQQKKLAEQLQGVVEKTAGIRELTITPASTSILWIEEQYAPESDSFRKIVEVASKWGAAVELMQVLPPDGGTQEHQTEEGLNGVEPVVPHHGPGTAAIAYDGGIEDDVPETGGMEVSGGIGATTRELTRLGVAGGYRAVRGGQDKVLGSIDRTITYSLIVVGSLFGSKGHAVQTRMTREMRSFLQEHVKVPTVSPEDLKSQYLFGSRQLLKLLGCAAASLFLFGLVMSHQEPILRFLSPTTVSGKVLAAASVGLFAPLFAYLYGTAVGLVLKLLKVE